MACSIGRATLAQVHESLGDRLNLTMASISRWFTVFGSTIVCAAACGATGGRAPSAVADNFCGRGGHLRPFASQIVAKTVEPSGEVTVWLPPKAFTPDGKEPAQPPAASPLPEGPSDTERAADSAMTMEPPQSLGRGPAGTVPLSLTKANMCECDEGFVKLLDGSCAAIEDVCAPEGRGAGRNPLAMEYTLCCPGLSPVSIYRKEQSRCVLDPHYRGQTCVKCGNGICGPGEDECNCPLDCSKKK